MPIFSFSWPKIWALALCAAWVSGRASHEPQALAYFATAILLGVHVGLSATLMAYPRSYALQLQHWGAWAMGMLVTWAVAQGMVWVLRRFHQQWQQDAPGALLMLGALALMLAEVDRQVQAIRQLHRRLS